jgi:(E)-4-hydroxy-3-methyl-but-2-enyl pyrophosphate reductase
MKHKIFISGNSGYCMGVKKAFIKSLEISKKYTDVVLYGEMVHNRFALQTLADNGIKIINSLEEILNDKKIRNVIIRAHGIPPDEEALLRKSDKTIFDLTCPKVKQVQILSSKLTKENYRILIFGKKDHPEVKGIKGYCKDNNFVIKNIDDTIKIPFGKIDKIAFISQTTMNSDDFVKIADKVKSEFKNTQIFNTLCASPVKTQVEAVNLARKVGIMIIVGDKMSANNNTLFEKVSSVTDSVFIETPDQLDFEKLRNYEKIGISGGSSTPDWQIEEIKKTINIRING